MKISQLLLISSIFASTTFVAMQFMPADAARSCLGNKAECSCQVALDVGSRQAMRKFLREYPRADTICNATASTATDVNNSGAGGNNGGPNAGSSSGASGGPGGGPPSGGSNGGGCQGGGGGNCGNGQGSSGGNGNGNEGNGNGNEGNGHGRNK